MNTTNRRNFLKRTAALGAAATMPLASLHAGDRRKHTVGHGDFTYTVDPDWGNLDPRKHPLQHCHEMVVDARGRLVCSSVSNRHDTLVYSKDGKLLDSWQNGIVEPHGLSKSGEGNDQSLWITDSAKGRVVNLDLDGRVLRELPRPTDHIPDGKDYKPTETAITDEGDIYVADGYGTNNIYHYDRRGTLVNVFGGPEHFDCCHGIVVDRRTPTPTLLITSRAHNNFQRWSLDGKHLTTRELPGLTICRPVIHGENTYFAVIVTESWWSYDGMVAVLDKDFNVVSLPGGSAPANQTDFKNVEYDNRTFLNPHDVCVDEDENLYVPQWFSGRTYPLRLERV